MPKHESEVAPCNKLERIGRALGGELPPEELARVLRDAERDPETAASLATLARLAGALPASLSEAAASTPCLTEAEALRYVCRRATSAEMSRIETHLAACPHCARLLRDVVRTLEFYEQYVVQSGASVRCPHCGRANPASASRCYGCHAKLRLSWVLTIGAGLIGGLMLGLAAAAPVLARVAPDAWAELRSGLGEWRAALYALPVVGAGLAAPLARRLWRCRRDRGGA